MGSYINLKDPYEGHTYEESKIIFLEKNGLEIDLNAFLDYTYKDEEKAVVVVDNGLFLACAIMYDSRELDDWVNIMFTDTRPKRFFIIPTHHVEKYIVHE